MKLKLVLRNDGKNSEIISSISWSGPDEVYSAGDDHQILKWNLFTGDFTVVAKLPGDLYPTDLRCIPRQTGSKSSGSNSDVFALCSTDGKLFIVSKTGRIEKTVEAHLGAILSVKWNHTGTDLLTAGEDGLLKVWSRSGMLRSTLSQSPNAVYGASWSPNSDRVLHTSGRQLIIKPMQPNAKQISWKAHDGIILAIDWNASNDLIVSGGEDCKYRIWDSYGRQMFNSSSHDHPITSVSWSPDGDLFAIGSFNTLRLCDRVGWSHSLEKPSSGSIYSISWSNDSTQLAGGCGNGSIVFGHVIDRRLDWLNFSITVSGSKSIQVVNVSNDSKENLETKDRIIKVSLGHRHLVVATTIKCYIYSVNNWNTPAEFDLKEGNVSLIRQSEKYFLLVDGANIYIYSYDCRPVSSPKFHGMRADTFNRHTLSISDDTVAVRDKNDEKVVYLFELTSGKPVGDGKPFVHQIEIVEVSLDKTGSATERRMTVVDRNRNVFLVQVRTFGSLRKIIKLGKVVESLCWCDDACFLACITEEKLKVWCWPNAAFIDKTLLDKAIFEKDASEFGKEPILQQFVGNQISIRRSDGSTLHTLLPPYFFVLQRCVTSTKWEEALKLCRFIDTESLWACLAAMSTYHKHLNTAEVAYASLDEPEKVQFLRRIRELPTKQSQQAEFALFSGQVLEAEGIYLQSGMIFRAIMLNLSLFNWDRALDLAIKHKTHLDTVIGHRRQYLQNFDKKETNKKFLHYSEEIKVNLEAVKAKVEAELQKERS